MSFSLVDTALGVGMNIDIRHALLATATDGHFNSRTLPELEIIINGSGGSSSSREVGMSAILMHIDGPLLVKMMI